MFQLFSHSNEKKYGLKMDMANENEKTTSKRMKEINDEEKSIVINERNTTAEHEQKMIHAVDIVG